MDVGDRLDSVFTLDIVDARAEKLKKPGRFGQINRFIKDIFELLENFSPQSLLKAAARFLMMITLMISIGAHWGVLQIAAWTSMVKVYSAEKGLVEGLKITFDGRHPCAMCKKIDEGRDAEKQHHSPATKAEQSHLSKWLGLEQPALFPQLSWHEVQPVVQHISPEPHFHSWDMSPPVPPPKLAA